MRSALLLALGLTAAIGSGAVWGADVGARSDRRRTPLTPAASAFAIWGLLYALLILSCALQLARGDAPWRTANALLSASLLLAAAWVPAFARTRWMRVPALLLTGCSLCAFAAALSLPPWTRATALPNAAASLYSGWTAVASAVGWAMVLQLEGWSPWWPLAGLALSAALAAARGDAAFLLPIAWAVAWQTRTPPAYRAAALTVLLALATLALLAPAPPPWFRRGPPSASPPPAP